MVVHTVALAIGPQRAKMLSVPAPQPGPDIGLTGMRGCQHAPTFPVHGSRTRAATASLACQDAWEHSGRGGRRHRSATPHAAHAGAAAGRRRALVVAVVIASALATSPKMDFWSARRSTVVAPAPVVLATTAAAPAARARQRPPGPAPEAAL